MKRNIERARRHQRGVILIWLAVFLIAMLAFVALAIDGAKLMATKTELQNAADAAALAGASAVKPEAGSPGHPVLDQDKAKVRAELTASKNKAFVTKVEAVNDIEVSFPQADEIQVIAYRRGDTPMIAHIAQVVGMGKMEVRAIAVAKVHCPGCVSGLRPIGVGNYTDDPLVVGKEYQLATGFLPGNYQYLDFSSITCPEDRCNGTGADRVRCEMLDGFACCVDSTMVIPVQTGVMTGPIRQSIDSLFARDCNQHEYDSTTTNTYPDYKARCGNDSRVITIPLVQFNGIGGNNVTATVKAYATFFLKRRMKPPGQEYWGEYLQKTTAGSGTSGDCATAYTVSLIR